MLGSDGMKLIVGLGNPGKEYSKTRHNIGFMFLDYYYEYLKLTEKWSKKFNGLYLETTINGEKVILLKPQSFMNLSGGVVRKYIEYFNIDIEDLFVISDDLDLNFLNFKLKDKGSCGGHNGLRDIENNIKTTEYKRLKIGISNNKDMDTKDYVTGNFTSSNLKDLDKLFSELMKVMDDYYVLNFNDLMCKYNRKNK